MFALARWRGGQRRTPIDLRRSGTLLALVLMSPLLNALMNTLLNLLLANRYRAGAPLRHGLRCMRSAVLRRLT